jgi:hypothetical protein
LSGAEWPDQCLFTSHEIVVGCPVQAKLGDQLGRFVFGE